MKNHAPIGALLALVLLAGGCRGMESDNEPIHPNPNMDVQARYNAQEESDFFENGMAMRPPVPGTVAKGFLREDTRFFTGATEDGQYVDRVPVPVTQALLQRGRERYNIFCSVCHGQAGFGQGVIMTGEYGYTPAPSYHQATLRDTADGYVYEVITNGVRNMPGYAAQVPVADRWAIVAYIRALQRSQNASRENVPPSVLARIEQTGSANMNAARNPSGPGGGGSGAGSSGSGGSGSGGSGSGDDASVDTAAAGPTATAAPADDAPADDAAQQQQAAAAGSDAAGSDTAGSGAAGAATASADTAAGGEAGVDTASQQTAVAEGASTDEGAAEEGAADVATGGEQGGEAAAATGGASANGAGGGGGFFGSTFSILLLVVLPIVALCGMLVAAFRKDREH